MFWRNDTEFYDQNTFYGAFMKDITRSKKRVIIESPFITMKRINQIAPTLSKLADRGVLVVVNTKPIDEHDALLYGMARHGIATLQDIGVNVIVTAGYRRKLAIIDEDIVWEGSLNILSQNDSREVMRRIHSKQLTGQMLDFLDLGRFYGVK
jgi:hypothetical protein